MPKTKDILSKVWLRRGTNGILSRRLCGGDIVEHLPTEQPEISNRAVDMLVRNDKGLIQHVEFQATNELGIAFRMLVYWVYFRGELGTGVRQCVFYIGNEPMRLPSEFAEGRTTHAFDIINLQDYDAADLLESPDWGDNLWALGATRRPGGGAGGNSVEAEGHDRRGTGIRPRRTNGSFTYTEARRATCSEAEGDSDAHDRPQRECRHPSFD